MVKVPEFAAVGWLRSHGNRRNHSRAKHLSWSVKSEDGGAVRVTEARKNDEFRSAKRRLSTSFLSPFDKVEGCLDLFASGDSVGRGPSSVKHIFSKNYAVLT